MKLLAPVMLLAVLACSSNKSSKTVQGDPSTAAECKADTDCVVVETACCDHCNGGKAEAFPKSKPSSPAAGCDEVACTEMACGPALPHCDAGKCTVKIGPL
jgi:hypothetical protein